jgi:hypothetical protein
MTKYIKSKDGKFAGSIGDGKDSVPTVAPKVPKAPKLTKTQQARIDYNERMREMKERHAAMLPEILARRERQEAARQSWFTISESVNSSYPEARWMILDENKELVRLTDRDGNTVAEGADVTNGDSAFNDNLAVFAQHEDIVGDRYKKDDGHRVGIFYLCGEDGCTHRFYPEGFQPGHTASVRCMSGRRPHCTCDTCF